MKAQLGIQNSAGRLLHRVSGSLASGREKLGHLAARLHTGSSRLLMLYGGRLEGAAPRLQRAALIRLTTEGNNLDTQQERLIRELPRALQTAHRKLVRFEENARLLDPARLLARGYSLTTGSNGKTITSSCQLAAGETILTQFAQGRVRSIVQPGADTGKPKPTPSKGKKRGSKQEKAGQKSLFR